MDLTWWLVIAAMITGTVWAYDAFIAEKERRPEPLKADGSEAELKNQPAMVEMSRFLFQLIVLVLLIRYFLSANINFALVLVVLTFVTGVIWAIDTVFFAKPRRAKAPDAETVAEPVLVEFARFLFPVVLIVLILRSFIAEPFKIPSGSMLPTLEVGDFILVNKFSYGIRLPVLNTKVIDFGGPQRGDVIVFRYPENPSIDYIKRVIGVPGDEIAYYNKVLTVNGKPALQEHQGNYIEGYKHINRYKENLAGVEHDILLNYASAAHDFVITVPENKYFAMGDNRDNSRDSRVWGYVPDENLVGKANLVWMNWDCTFEALFKLDCSMPKWHRIANSID